MYTSNSLRKKFLEFFEQKGHKIVPSSPIVPKNDSTLLFTSAGMVQFKKLWSGEVPLPYRRATTIQRCLRGSDIDEVGKSELHHTFFEMMGNFSFGDYFKYEAIKWAWEFLTEVIGLDQDKLYATIYKDDEEAYNIWKKEIGLSPKKIERLNENFWGPAGKTGPCGPCSEILFKKNNDFIELWNLVFPQYYQNEDGKREPLKNRGIDTGMGLERLALICQNKESTYETDLFTPIVKETLRILKRDYQDSRTRVNIISDHIRGLVFALAEGVYPSNEGRGYFLRRILRRATLKGRELGMRDSFLYKLVPVVTAVMREPYPELSPKRENISGIIKSEEERFLSTIEQGESILNDMLSKRKELSGRDIFRLYDTYGFPPELTVDLAKRKGFSVSLEGFNEWLEKQKELSRRESKFEESSLSRWKKFLELNSQEFTGYTETETEAEIARVRSCKNGIEVILTKTPFYGESGGQVGDTGRIYSQSFEFEVRDTRIEPPFYIHSGVLLKGEIKKGKVIAKVNRERRKRIARNHTATHLLHSALRKVLGEWVHQEGSLVAPDRLRFDFTHFSPISNYEKKEIEEILNSWILEDIPVTTRIMPLDEARKMGATALFGEKYGKLVRVVQIGDVSMEVCGGTHVTRTGEIGLIKIISGSSIHAGVRRIEALTGDRAYDYLSKCEERLLSMSSLLKTGMENIENRIEQLVEKETSLKKRVRKLEARSMGIDEILKQRRLVGEIKVVSKRIDGVGKEALRGLADRLRSRKKSAGVLAMESNGKPFFVSFVSDDLVNKLKAGDIAREIGKRAGGGGGGKSHIAESGGKDISKIDEILRETPEIIKKVISSR
jgi:alanyl-tRNA synthetase